MVLRNIQFRSAILEHSDDVSRIDNLLPLTVFSTVLLIISILSNIAATSYAIGESKLTMCCKCQTISSNCRVKKSRLSRPTLWLFSVCLNVLDVIFLTLLSNSSECDILFVIFTLLFVLISDKSKRITRSELTKNKMELH